MTDGEDTRALFEEKVFADYYVRNIRRNPSAGKGISGALDFVPAGRLSKQDLCATDASGNYIRSDVSAMWHGWKLCLKAR